MKLLSNLLFSRQATTSDVHDPARIILKAWSDTSAGYFRLVLPSSNPKEDSCWVSGTSAAYFCQVLASDHQSEVIRSFKLCYSPLSR